MVVRLVLWNLADSVADVESLRRYLRDESVDAFADARRTALQGVDLRANTDRWGAFYVFESREASEQPLPSRARELIGKEPEIIEMFDLEATVSTASELAHLGLAFDEAT